MAGTAFLKDQLRNFECPKNPQVVLQYNNNNCKVMYETDLEFDLFNREFEISTYRSQTRDMTNNSTKDPRLIHFSSSPEVMALDGLKATMQLVGNSNRLVMLVPKAISLVPRFRFINNLSISIKTNLFKLSYPNDENSVNKVLAWVGKDVLLTGAFQVIRLERFHRDSREQEKTRYATDL